MDLPAVDRLGYALNLTDITPFDIGAVCTIPSFHCITLTTTYKVDNHVIYLRRLLSIDLDNVRDLVIGGHLLLLRLCGHQNYNLCQLDGVTYSVPRDVSVTADNQIVRGEYITFPEIGRAHV